MTHKQNDTVIICHTEPAECSECGKVDELRPYGKDAAWVCFPCGMKDEAEMEKQFHKLFTDDRDI